MIHCGTKPAGFSFAIMRIQCLENTPQNAGESHFGNRGRSCLTNGKNDTTVFWNGLDLALQRNFPTMHITDGFSPRSDLGNRCVTIGNPYINSLSVFRLIWIQT